MVNREKQLLELGFKHNEHQECYYLNKYDVSWYKDSWKIWEYSENDWYTYIECLKQDIKEAKLEQEREELYLLGFSAAEKGFKKKLMDKYNALNSQLQETGHIKLGKRVNVEKVAELKAKVELLKELMK